MPRACPEWAQESIAVMPVCRRERGEERSFGGRGGEWREAAREKQNGDPAFMFLLRDPETSLSWLLLFHNLQILFCPLRPCSVWQGKRKETRRARPGGRRPFPCLWSLSSHADPEGRQSQQIHGLTRPSPTATPSPSPRAACRHRAGKPWKNNGRDAIRWEAGNPSSQARAGRLSADPEGLVWSHDNPVSRSHCPPLD